MQTEAKKNEEEKRHTHTHNKMKRTVIVFALDARGEAAHSIDYHPPPITYPNTVFTKSQALAKANHHPPPLRTTTQNSNICNAKKQTNKTHDFSYFSPPHVSFIPSIPAFILALLRSQAVRLPNLLLIFQLPPCPTHPTPC